MSLTIYKPKATLHFWEECWLPLKDLPLCGHVFKFGGKYLRGKFLLPGFPIILWAHTNVHNFTLKAFMFNRWTTLNSHDNPNIQTQSFPNSTSDKVVSLQTRITENNGKAIMNRGVSSHGVLATQRYHPQIWLHRPQIQLGLWGDYVKLSVVVFASYWSRQCWV